MATRKKPARGSKKDRAPKPVAQQPQPEPPPHTPVEQAPAPVPPHVQAPPLQGDGDSAEEQKAEGGLPPGAVVPNALHRTEQVMPVSQVAAIVQTAVDKAVSRIEVGQERTGSPLKHQGIKPSPGMKVVVRIVMGTYAGMPMERDRVFQLSGLRTDEKLLRLEYVRPLDPKATLHACRVCNAEFVSLNGLNGHGHRTHVEPTIYLSPNEIKEREEARDRKIMQETPPRFDRTEASQNG
jgi:hypothetical protein